MNFEISKAFYTAFRFVKIESEVRGCFENSTSIVVEITG